MAPLNFLNLKPADSDKAIYRIVPCERFLQMLREQQNGLVLPKLWDDPFENFILNGTAVASDGTKARFGFQHSIYGQCWSLHIETDAMWRIYSPDKCGVKLKTTIRNLFDSLYQRAGRFRDVSCFIGKVSYLPKHGIADAIRNAHVLDPSGAGAVETLLVKRKAFAPEREVRLIYFKPRTRPRTGTVRVRANRRVFKYPVDVNVLVNEAVLDPRLDDHDVASWKSRFKAAGFRNRIIQSGLYKPPKTSL